MLRLDEKANGTTVAVKLGDTVEVSLPENPTTGYRWVLVPDPNLTASLVSAVFVPNQGVPPANVGVGGTRTWTFTAAAGRGQIRLVSRQDDNDPPKETFSVTLTIS
jgi:inhibitor of cysteine peptidase